MVLGDPGLLDPLCPGGDPAERPPGRPTSPTDPARVLNAALSTAAAIRKFDCDFWAPYYNAL